MVFREFFPIIHSWDLIYLLYRILKLGKSHWQRILKYSKSVMLVQMKTFPMRMKASIKGSIGHLLLILLYLFYHYTILNGKEAAFVA